VVGYGLDYAEFYRNLPFIGIPYKEVMNRSKWVYSINPTMIKWG